MGTLLVRLKPYDPRRGYVLRGFAYLGLKFKHNSGWYRVPKDVGTYLKTVRQVETNLHSPLAFDVFTDEEARQIDNQAEIESAPRKAVDAVQYELPTEDAISSTAEDPFAPSTTLNATSNAHTAPGKPTNSRTKTRTSK